jgi:hypothetical protein
MLTRFGRGVVRTRSDCSVFSYSEDTLRILDLEYLLSPNHDPVFWTPELLDRPSFWWGHVPFAFWLVAKSEPLLLVELGTEYGVSYAAFCEAVARSRLATRCYAIDTWKGDLHVGAYGEDVYSGLKDFHDKQYASFSQLLRRSFDEARSDFADGSIDLLHIDGVHTYEAVRHDFDAWRSKLSDRAVALLHDTNERQRDFGVWRLFAELKREMPTFEFLHSHGLGIVAVGTHVPEPIKKLCRLTDGVEIAKIRDRFSYFGARWSAEHRAREEAAQTRALERKLAAAGVENSAVERRLAEAGVEKSTVERKLAEVSVEKSSAKHRLESLTGRLGVLQSELDRQRSEVDRLNSLFFMAQRLARRAGKFPFSIYFRGKKKYRAILKSLRTETVLAVALPTLSDKPTASAAVAEAAPQEPHPGGFKAESLAHLHSMIPPEIVKAQDLRYGDEPLVSAAAIHEALAEKTKDTNRRGLILSFSHDDYATIRGGTQLCVGIEEREARAEGFDYLHVHPLANLQFLAPANVADLPFLRLTLNGSVLGICSYLTLRDAAKQFRENGVAQFVVIHHLLNHAIEPVSEIIQATGRRRCWFWLHDFFTICTNPHLLRNGMSFCGAPRSDSAGCGICAFGVARKAHQKRISTFFEETEIYLIAPSEFVADLWRDRAGLRYASLTIKPHLELEWTTVQSNAKTANRPVRVAFIGAPSLHKGWPYFRKLAEEYRQDENYDFLYFGVHSVDLSVPRFYVNVTNDNQGGMIDALREAGVDIVLHVSPTPETFSFTTSEALASGAFVVTNAGSGNTARTVAQTGRGLVLDHEMDVDAAFARGDVLRLGKKARELRVAERSKVTYSKMTIPFLVAESM